jgi:uncharacterized surface protein with fasciclin (FAS1) repeats
MTAVGPHNGYQTALYQSTPGYGNNPHARHAGMVYAAHHGEKSMAPTKTDIVDTAIAAGSFDTLVTAVKAADLVSTLKGDGPFTVFAPTDAAFAKLPKSQLEALLGNKAALTRILTYHVVPGKVEAADVVKLTTARTVEGQSLTIKTGDSVMIDNATVIKTDIATSNGVIHVIDTVMLPPDML